MYLSIHTSVCFGGPIAGFNVVSSRSTPNFLMRLASVRANPNISGLTDEDRCRHRGRDGSTDTQWHDFYKCSYILCKLLRTTFLWSAR